MASARTAWKPKIRYGILAKYPTESEAFSAVSRSDNDGYTRAQAFTALKALRKANEALGNFDVVYTVHALLIENEE